MPPSALMEVIFDKMGHGAHLTDLRQFAHGAVLDGAETGRLIGFASAGGWGKHPQNIERDLCKWLSNLFDVQLEPMYINLMLDTDDSLSLEEVRVPVLSIHEMFNAIWRAGPAQRDFSLFGKDGLPGLLEFWQHAQESRWGQLHPVVLNGKDLAKCFGVVIHIDGTLDIVELGVGTSGSREVGGVTDWPASHLSWQRQKDQCKDPLAQKHCAKHTCCGEHDPKSKRRARFRLGVGALRNRRLTKINGSMHCPFCRQSGT